MMDILKILLTVLVPPLGVFLHTGVSKQLLLNILLTMLGYLPGVVHAIYVISQPKWYYR